jgi:hypothetical protein
VGKLKHGEMRIQHLANLSTVFKFLQNYVKLVDIGPQDVLDGNEVRILGLLWSIISVFSLRSMNTNMPGCRHMGDLKQRLLAWAQVRPHSCENLLFIFYFFFPLLCIMCLVATIQ